MEIKINRPEEPEGLWYGDTAVIDQGGVDILFEDGRRYSANWGDYFSSEVGSKLILDEFNDASNSDRVEIYNSLCELAAVLGSKLD